ncbi:lichenicidin A2 family type 2 lantibiotic [uncultured Bifidobacterium sp.]|uniref:lichenicidin A2 family type 2 lantibiotic n=1 Tax=uncultured Bifidobacterium sp. TaxID=165187 RepID=UPI00258B730C|nr:lichenicidin A2 family type 2 lantibiotic [uncultured Bifidobacterium sp.]
MRMNEKAIVGETFDDLTNQEMAMLTGRGDVEPYSLGVISAVAVSLELSLSYSVVSVTTSLSLSGNCKK